MKTYSKKKGNFEIVRYPYEDNKYIILENGFDCFGQYFSLREVITVFKDINLF